MTFFSWLFLNNKPIEKIDFGFNLLLATEMPLLGFYIIYGKWNHTNIVYMYIMFAFTILNVFLLIGKYFNCKAEIKHRKQLKLLQINKIIIFVLVVAVCIPECIFICMIF